MGGCLSILRQLWLMEGGREGFQELFLQYCLKIKYIVRSNSRDREVNNKGFKIYKTQVAKLIGEDAGQMV